MNSYCGLLSWWCRVLFFLLALRLSVCPPPLTARARHGNVEKLRSAEQTLSSFLMIYIEDEQVASLEASSIRAMERGPVRPLRRVQTSMQRTSEEREEEAEWRIYKRSVWWNEINSSLSFSILMTSSRQQVENEHENEQKAVSMSSTEQWNSSTHWTLLFLTNVLAVVSVGGVWCNPNSRNGAQKLRPWDDLMADSVTFGAAWITEQQSISSATSAPSLSPSLVWKKQILIRALKTPIKKRPHWRQEKISRVNSLELCGIDRQGYAECVCVYIN